MVLILGVLAGGWLWLRDSSLVAVRRVTVTGLTGPDAGRIRSALILAARNMTTLDVNRHALDTAVAPYPVVKSLGVSTQFPHGMRIRVIEQNPVAEIAMSGGTIAVASDGTLLHDARRLPQLPTIALRSLPGGTRITDQNTLEVVALLAAAPYQLLAHVSNAGWTATHGLVAQLRNGPTVYFGTADRLAAKWIAATAVLADNGSAGADYIDVTDPDRPVAGADAGSGAAPSAASAPATSASGAASAPATSAASPAAAEPPPSTAAAPSPSTSPGG